MWIHSRFVALQLITLGFVSTGCDVDPDELAESERAIPTPERCANDDWEPNDNFKQAYHVTWDKSFSAELDAQLCPGEEDWYFFETDLGYAKPNFTISVLVENADLCECQGPTLPPGPENTITVWAYRADTLELLTTHTDDHGRIGFQNIDPDYGHNVLIRVFSPTKAEFPYDVSASIHDGPTGDDCEC